MKPQVKWVDEIIIYFAMKCLGLLIIWLESIYGYYNTNALMEYCCFTCTYIHLLNTIWCWPTILMKK